MTVHVHVCAVCAREFDASRDDAITCGDACRAARYRSRLRDHRERLHRAAEAAAQSGDIAELTRVARATAALLG